MSKIDFNQLSKLISHALRHQPFLYGLYLDKDGWVDIDLLISSIKKTDINYDNLSVLDIKEMIKLSKKQRHEIYNNRIRASYGHSIENKIQKLFTKPPEYLYHSTKPETLASIFEKGLLPMRRQYVHLSENKVDAINVALRKTSTPILIRINSEEAYQDSVNFYKEAGNLWLADEIDRKYLKKIDY